MYNMYLGLLEIKSAENSLEYNMLPREHYFRCSPLFRKKKKKKFHDLKR